MDIHLAWEVKNAMGDPEIVIAVLDNYLTYHPDFGDTASIDTIDFVGAVRDPIVMDSCCVPVFCDSCAHGYAVTGLLLAEHNDIGLAGLVPGCKLIFIKIVDDNNNCGYEYQLADAIVFGAQRGANIMSNSWGCYGCTPTDDMTYALNCVTDPTMMGYSCSIFFSAGNSGSSPWYYNVSYPGNMPQVMAVGASDSVDCHWAYSCYGPTLDFVALSGNVKNVPEGYEDEYLLGSIMTIDRVGDSGYTPHYYLPPYIRMCRLCDTLIDPLEEIGNDYFCSFGGTSAACPQAAGIAAMVMSRRLELADSNDVIYSIIKGSAEDQVGPSTGPTPDLPGWDQYYGWGRVNALRALLAISRGDADNSGEVDILDVTYIINYLYKSGPEPEPHPLMADAEGDGDIDILDSNYIINYLYKNGSPPPISFNYGTYW